MTRLYISGPVTGRPYDNEAAFREAQTRLFGAGYGALIPHDLVLPEDPRETAMLLRIHDLTALDKDSGCMSISPLYDGLALLPGWGQSEGAKLEKAVAEACGIPVKTVDEWIEETI